MLHVDWLGVSLGLPSDYIAPRSLQWEEFTPTNVWQRRMLFHHDGDKVATLLASPRSSLISQDAALLEISNEWFYHGRPWWQRVQDFMEGGGWERGLSRLDLCYDFCPSEEVKAIIMGLASGEYYVAGKRAGSLFWSIDNNPKLHPMWRECGRKPHSLSFGHKTSGITWKLYYKSKELLDATGGVYFDKPYIVDCWRCAGMDISNVWRLEVSIHQGNGYRMLSRMTIGDEEPQLIALNTESVRDNMADIYGGLLKRRFIIRRDEGHRDKRNDTQVYLFDYQGGTEVRNYINADSVPRFGRTTLLRHIIRDLEQPECYNNTICREAMLTSVTQIVRADHLNLYFAAMNGGLELEDWCDEVRRRASPQCL